MESCKDASERVSACNRGSSQDLVSHQSKGMDGNPLALQIHHGSPK